MKINEYTILRIEFWEDKMNNKILDVEKINGIKLIWEK